MTPTPPDIARPGPCLGPIGTARPACVMAQADVAAMGAVASHAKDTDSESPAENAAPRSRLRSIFRRVGVDERALVVGGAAPADPGVTTASGSWFFDHRSTPGTAERMTVYHQHASGLACDAARMALDRVGIDPSAITHLVTASCTGFAAPGVDIELINRLGLELTVARSNVGFMGCHAAVNALRLAAAIAGTDPDARVLVCCVELCSIHLQHEDTPERDVVNALFGDGAAAAVVSQTPLKHSIGTLDSFGAQLWPDGADAMRWDITDAGFRMGLGRDVPALIRRGVRTWLATWLHNRGLTVQNIGSWAIHPGGPSVIDAVRDGLGLDEAACSGSREVLRRCGNMSSATLLFVLDDLAQGDRPTPTVAVAFGPGLAGEALLLG